MQRRDFLRLVDPFGACLKCSQTATELDFIECALFVKSSNKKLMFWTGIPSHKKTGVAASHNIKSPRPTICVLSLERVSKLNAVIK